MTSHSPMQFCSLAIASAVVLAPPLRWDQRWMMTAVVEPPEILSIRGEVKDFISQ